MGKSGLNQLEASLYRTVQSASFRYGEPFRCDSQVWQTDRQTGGRLAHSIWRSSLRLRGQKRHRRMTESGYPLWSIPGVAGTVAAVRSGRHIRHRLGHRWRQDNWCWCGSWAGRRHIMTAVVVLVDGHCIGGRRSLPSCTPQTTSIPGRHRSLVAAPPSP